MCVWCVRTHVYIFMRESGADIACLPPSLSPPFPKEAEFLTNLELAVLRSSELAPSRTPVSVSGPWDCRQPHAYLVLGSHVPVLMLARPERHQLSHLPAQDWESMHYSEVCRGNHCRGQGEWGVLESNQQPVVRARTG